jgi:hypothetical protein
MQEVCFVLILNFYLFFSSSCHLRYVYNNNNNKNSDYRVAFVPMCRDEGRQKETSLCYRSIQLSVGYDFWWFVSAFVFVIVDGGRRARRECENTGRLRTSAGRARTVCGELESTRYICQRRKRRFSELWYPRELLLRCNFFSIPFDTSFINSSQSVCCEANEKLGAFETTPACVF